MTVGLVGQSQITTFSSPVNGTSPIDANVVRSNDNSIKTSYNVHDADSTIHFQSSLNAARPIAATLGRKWLDNDTYHVFYDDGSAWHEIAYLQSAGGTISGDLSVTGTVGVGTAVTANIALNIASTALTTVSQVGVQSRPVFSSSATTSGRAIDVQLKTAAAAFTLIDGAGLFINSPSIGATSAITNAYGVRIADQTGGTNNYAIFCDGKNDVVLNGSGAAVATNATVGFLYMPSCAGTPTGTPAQVGTGRVPWIFDSTNSKICVYTGGAWIKTAALT